jgi:putative transposase
MAASLSLLTALRDCIRTAALALLDFGRLVALMARSRSALSAENLFLRKQLALFQERKVKPSLADDSTRWMMAALSRLFNWRDALVAV